MASTSVKDFSTNSGIGSILWNRLLDIIGDDPENVCVYATPILVILVYWGYAGLWTIVDMTGRPRWVMKYKMQPDQNAPVEKSKYWKATKVVLFNQIFTTIPCLALLWRDLKHDMPNIRSFPSLLEIAKCLAVMIVIEEIVFYYAHRLLHHPSIYKYVHKKHHEWTSPIAVITFYCHPLEHIACNMGPIGISMKILHPHIAVVWIFTVMAIINAMTDHAGYSFPFPFYKSAVVNHDFHHAKSKFNYGVLGVLDRLHGTYKENTMLQKTANGDDNNISKVK